MKNFINVFSVHFLIFQKKSWNPSYLCFLSKLPSFKSKNRKCCFLGIHPSFSQSNGLIIELSIWVRTLLKFKSLLQPRDPRTTRSQSVQVFQNNVGPGLPRDWIFFSVRSQDWNFILVRVGL